MEENAITALRLAGDELVGFGLWSLVTQADPVVKAVLALLVLASIWSWTVIFDKGFRLARLRRKTRAFERAFWSGAALDDLYRRLGREADHPMAMLFAAAMEEWRDFAEAARRQRRPRAARADRQGHVADPRARAGGVGAPSQLARDDRLDRALRRPVRHGLGHHEQLPVDRADQEHHARGGRPRHCRGPAGDRARPDRRDSGGGRLQQAVRRRRALRQSRHQLRRRVHRGAVPRARERSLAGNRQQQQQQQAA